MVLNRCIKLGWTELGRFWLSNCGCVNVALWGWVLMVFDFGWFVIAALFVANCGDVVETRIEVIGRDWGSK